MSVKLRAQAIDRFIKGCKADGIYDDLKAACVMAGWDSLAGALTPLVGAAPTNSGFIASDYDRGVGLAGDGASYLNANRKENDDPQNDRHMSVYQAVLGTSVRFLCGTNPSGVRSNFVTVRSAGSIDATLSSSQNHAEDILGTGFAGAARTSGTDVALRCGSQTFFQTASSGTPTSNDLHIYKCNNSLSFENDGTLSFYSVGSATDLAALDARVSTLMADLRAIEEIGFDRDALAYIRAVEAADGAYLETDVKVAINNLVSGLKADGLWSSIGSSCLLCGPRTLAGALVPLRGDAPTPNGFVSGDYSRTDGLRDPNGTSLLDTNRSATDDPQDDVHLAAHLTALQSGGGGIVAAFDAGPPVVGTQLSMTAGGNFFTRCRTTNDDQTNPLATGFVGLSRSSSSEYSKRNNGSTADLPETSVAQTALNYAVFSNATSGQPTTDAAIAFYSIGTSLDLAKLDSHISSYVTAIGAAL